MLVAKLPGSTYAIAATNAGPRYGSAARTRPRRPTRGASGSDAIASWAAITVIMARLNHDFGTQAGARPPFRLLEGWAPSLNGAREPYAPARPRHRPRRRRGCR